jgi:CubicO group peptidase (beta-lactamase class C family)
MAAMNAQIRRLFVLPLVLAAIALGQANLPDTPAAKLMKGWLESFNAGNQAAHAKFLSEHQSPADRNNDPPEKAAERQMRFRAMVGGGFDPYKVEESSPNEIKVLAKEKGGFGWAELTFHADPANPAMIASTDFNQVPVPPELRPTRADQAALVSDVDALLTKLTAEDRFSGVVLLAKDGRPFFQKAYGYANRDKRIPNDMNTRFRLGSMNKMFTSVAIAQLVEQGRMSYTDTVAKLLPDYPDKDIAAKITVHQLLTHTSGLGDFFGPDFAKKKESLHGLNDYLQLFAGKPLKFEPGKGWAYSNAGMIVAGLIVERVSGQNYYDYVREHIYKIAGMKDSDTFDKTKPQPDQSIGYTRQEEKWVANFDSLPLMGSSAGGGDSTAPDLLRFDQALRGHKLLNEELTNTIVTPKVDVPDEPDKYGYGFMENHVDGKRVVGHGGGAPGMNANLDMYWDTGYTVVVLANLDPPIAQQVNNYIRDRIKQ